MPPKKKFKGSASGILSTHALDQNRTVITPRSAPSPSSNTVIDAWTDEQEASLFKALIWHKPTGMNKHFSMLSIYQFLQTQGFAFNGSGLDMATIWTKLRSLYDLETLDERENNYLFAELVGEDDEGLNEAEEDENKISHFNLVDKGDEWRESTWARRLPSEAHSSPPLNPELVDGVTLKGKGKRTSMPAPPTPRTRGRTGTFRSEKRHSVATSVKPEKVKNEPAEIDEVEDDDGDASTVTGSPTAKGRTGRKMTPARRSARKR